MQISASNLLIASQQPQAPAQQPKAAASFAAALKTDTAAEAKTGFGALPFRKADAQPVLGPANSEEPKQAGSPPASRPGANLDIRI